MIPDSLRKIGNESKRLLAESMVEMLNGSPDPAQTLAKAARGKKLAKEYRRGMREFISKMKAEIALSKAAPALGKNPDAAREQAIRSSSSNGGSAPKGGA